MPEREHVTKIVSAFAKRNPLPAEQLPALIAAVHAALAGAEGGIIPEPIEKLVPAVPIKRSVQPDAIACLECGFKAKMIKRHLMTAHNMYPGDYRKRWRLKDDYPMVAPNYATARSALAKSFGLGRGGRRRAKAT